jgi:hypothetical protein
MYNDPTGMFAYIAGIGIGYNIVYTLYMTYFNTFMRVIGEQAYRSLGQAGGIDLSNRDFVIGEVTNVLLSALSLFIGIGRDLGAITPIVAVRYKIVGVALGVINRGSIDWRSDTITSFRIWLSYQNYSGASNVLGVFNDILTTVRNFNNMMIPLTALMSVYYSGSIGVKLYSLLIRAFTSEDQGDHRAVLTEITAMSELGMLDMIRDQIPDIFAAVTVALARYEQLNR